MKKIINFFKNKKKEPSTDFSYFFHNASAKEKKKLFEKVISEANRDQINLIKKANMLN